MKTFKAHTRLVLTSAVLAIGGVSFSSALLAHEEKGHEGHDHSPAKHDHTAKAGGIVVDMGHYDGELVATDGAITLMLRDHDGKDAVTEGYKATVIVLAGSERKGPFELAPAGGNKLEGKGVALQSGHKAIVTLTDAAGKASQARFEAK